MPMLAIACYRPEKNKSRRLNGLLRKHAPGGAVDQPFCMHRETVFGPVAVLWSYHGREPRILHVVLPKAGQSAERIVQASCPDVAHASCTEMDAVADRIAEFLAGGDIRFPLEIARMDRCSAFQQHVLHAEHAIPRGRVSTYQRIAGHLGKTGGARAVGRALASNPFPIIVPCHRAIRSDGTLGGYQGGTEMKRALLEMEGVCFDEAGRVDTKHFFY